MAITSNTLLPHPKKKTKEEKLKRYNELMAKAETIDDPIAKNLVKNFALMALEDPFELDLPKKAS